MYVGLFSLISTYIIYNMGVLGAAGYPHTYYEDVFVSEKEKNSIDYLQGNIDHWISALIRDKRHLKTYRGYYNGKRDNRDFEYLTDNFGIGTPSTLKFTNLIKSRVDSLVDQIETDSHSFAVSCVDNKTIDRIQEEKKRRKLGDIRASLEVFSQQVNSAIESGDKMPTYSELTSNLDQIKGKYDSNFLSDYEVAAQKVLTYFSKSNELDIKHKLALIAHDLIVTGESYWRVYYTRSGSDPELVVIKPENFFHNKNTNSSFIDGTDAVAHREFMTHKEVVMNYGKFLSKDDIKELFGERYMAKTARSLKSGLDLELYYSEDDPLLGQKHHSSANTVEVIHVEWLATNEVDMDGEEQRLETTVSEGQNNKPRNKTRRVDRYEGTRIGGTLYVNCGKSSNVTRSQNKPYDCGFSYNGMVNNDRGGEPYSVVGALKDLQDIYDLTIFYRDNLLATSGSPGDRVNVAGIPKVLGGDFMERLFKFMALKKNGVELIDPTEQGAQLFNHYGSFDNTVNGQSLMAIESLLTSIEHQADIIAGTNPQMLGNIKERDAVANVETGIQRSLSINQSIFGLFRSGHTKIMGSLLNTSQQSYRDGKKISYVAGTESYTFEILPENFCFSDFAIAISYSSKDSEKLMAMRGFAKELITTSMVDPDIMTKVILSDSVTEISKLISDNWRQKKSENDQVGQSSQTIEQLEQANKQLESELSNLKQQLEASKQSDASVKARESEQKLAIEREKVDIDRKKAEDANAYNNKQIELKEEVVQLEREQLYLGSGSAKEVKNL